MKGEIIQAMFDFIVVGNVGIDTNIYNPGNEIDFDVESSFTQNIDYVGNAGGYSARGFAQLGYRTAFIGYVGDDYSGRYILDEFKKDGINTDAVFIDPAGTSHSVNFMYPDGRRKNFYDGKSHINSSPDIEKCKSILRNSRISHFNIPNWARHLLPIAKDLGLIISCDLQDIVDLNDDYRQDFIRYSDVIFFSNVHFPDPQTIMNSVLEEFPDKILVSGMGAEGCALGTNNGIQYFDPVELNEAIVDTNGAGDGLAVGFLSGYYHEKMSLYESIQRGQIVARYTCTQKASTSNLITREKLNEIFSAIH